MAAVDRFLIVLLACARLRFNWPANPGAVGKLSRIQRNLNVPRRCQNLHGLVASEVPMTVLSCSKRTFSRVNFIARSSALNYHWSHYDSDFSRHLYAKYHLWKWSRFEISVRSLEHHGHDCKSDQASEPKHWIEDVA